MVDKAYISTSSEWTFETIETPIPISTRAISITGFTDLTDRQSEICVLLSFKYISPVIVAEAAAAKICI